VLEQLSCERSVPLPPCGGKWPDVLLRMPASCRQVFAVLLWELAKPTRGQTVEISLRDLGKVAGISHEQARRALRRLAGANVIILHSRGPGRGRRSEIRVLWRFFPGGDQGGQNVTPQALGTGDGGKITAGTGFAPHSVAGTPPSNSPPSPRETRSTESFARQRRAKRVFAATPQTFPWRGGRPLGDPLGPRH
jgi:hypothetical protein